MTAIHSLDARISQWWANVPTYLKVSSDTIAAYDKDTFPKMLLIETVYHQSLCALHASIVPLFSWSFDDDTWGVARQVSAQAAFEHAYAVSALFESVFTNFTELSAIPSFVGYAAYCSCAIQMPFLWSSNSDLKERIRSSIGVNVRMIHNIGVYWRFSALLVSTSSCFSAESKLTTESRAFMYSIFIECMRSTLSYSKTNLDTSIRRS